VEIIDARIHRYFQSDVNLYYQYLKSLMINQTGLINETYNDYKLWIDESIGYVCKQVYLDDNYNKLNISLNFTLGENYFNRNWPLIDQRLAQGGRRLASLLNRLVEHRSTMKISPHIQALIIVLCIEFVIIIFAVIGFVLFKRQSNTTDNVLIAEQSD
jgi:hypothetical protein